MTTFYTNYISLCAQKKKSPSAVAEEVGLSRTSPNGWKKGKKPSDVNLLKIADYFGVPVSALLEDKKETPTLSEEDERKNIMDLLDELSPAELVELMAKASAKLKERGLG